MRLLFASDSFKGTLSSIRTAELLTKAAEEIFPGCECRNVAVADGGEGTTDAVVSAAGGRKVGLTVHGPLWKPVNCTYGVLDENRVIMEMAEASGITRIAREERHPGKTTSYGTGEMIRDALDRGYTDVSIAIGGSATNDGGMGCMTALGARFLDKDGRVLRGCGNDLTRVKRIDLSGLDPRLKNCRFTVMCDVTNPLCGKNGATHTFGAQKGGTPEILEELEQGMCSYRDVIKNETGIDADLLEGAGAAGGMGAALSIFLNGTLRSGIETVLDLVDFESMLEGVSLVVTGEGAADRQSVFGKVMQGVGMRCRARGIPAVAVVGSMGEGAEELYEYGIESIITTVNGSMSLEEALERAEELYLNAARRMFRFLKAGNNL